MQIMYKRNEIGKIKYEISHIYFNTWFTHRSAFEDENWVTKKIRHRQDNTLVDASVSFKDCMVNNTVQESEMEEVMNDADVEIVESNVVIDGSGSVLIISLSPTLKD